MTPNKQLLKCRDDHAPVSFCAEEGCPDQPKQFKLIEGTTCSWVKSDSPFGVEVLRSRIEPWLTALFQSEHLSVLVGSGSTHALHKMAAGTSLPGMVPQTGGLSIAGRRQAMRRGCSTTDQGGRAAGDRVAAVARGPGGRSNLWRADGR